MKIAILGLDTSHAPAFTRWFQQTGKGDVCAAYPFDCPRGSLCASLNHKFASEMESLGVPVVTSLDQATEAADAWMVLTPSACDRSEIIQRAAGKHNPVFFDKYLALSTEQAEELVEQARALDVRICSSSALRFLPRWVDLMSSYGKENPPSHLTFRGPLHPRSDLPKYHFYALHSIDLLVSALGPDWTQCHRISPEEETFAIEWKSGAVAELSLTDKTDFSGQIRSESGVSTFESLEKSHPLIYAPLLGHLYRFSQGESFPVPLSESLSVQRLLEALSSDP